MGLTLRGIPLSLFETQAKTIVKVIADPTSLNTVSELGIIKARYEQLATTFGGDEKAIAKNWHKLTEPESFKYRDELNRFSGCSERVEDWGKEMWEQKVWSRRIHWRLAAKNKPAEALAISTDGTQTDLQNRINAHFNAHLRFKEDLIYFFIHV